MPNDVRDEIYQIQHRSVFTSLDGFKTTYNVGLKSKSCEKTDLLDVGGNATTGRDGKAHFKLSDFFCPKSLEFKIAFQVPVNFIATPYSKEVPVYLTVTKKAIADNDMEIIVNSWDKNGAPAANIHFNWRCFVAYDVYPHY